MTLSDIHGNIGNVRQLRKREPNGVDFIIVAGDIDYTIFPEFFQIMDSYECPVYVVYGNWDHDASYKRKLSRNAILLHNNIEEFGGYYITGFSGCEAQWGKNPHAIQARRREKLEDHDLRSPLRISSYKRIMRENRNDLFRAIVKAAIPQNRMILVTHDRLPNLAESGIHPMLHVFGHRHTHYFRSHKNSMYLNTAALDYGDSDRLGYKSYIPDDGYCIVQITPEELLLERKQIFTKEDARFASKRFKKVL